MITVDDNVLEITSRGLKCGRVVGCAEKQATFQHFLWSLLSFVGKFLPIVRRVRILLCVGWLLSFQFCFVVGKKLFLHSI